MGFLLMAVVVSIIPLVAHAEVITTDLVAPKPTVKVKTIGERKKFVYHCGYYNFLDEPESTKVRLYGQPTEAEIKYVNNKAILYVNGRPFKIKGVGYRSFANKEKAEKYFKLAKEMGANSIRQWSAAPNEDEILDLAYKYGLTVNLGTWLNWNISYKNTLEKQKKEILEYIKKYKDHPAILMWNLGNENIGKIKSEEEKIAYAKYVEDICQRIREIDPNHLICVSDVVAEGIPNLKYMPSVDIYGFNAYKAIEVAEQYAKIYKLDRPFIYSEFGPDGSWEVNLDENNVPQELDCRTKAQQYYKRWKLYIENNPNCLGGYAFILDGKYEETKTWWGITHNELRTVSFWALRKAYTGEDWPYNLPEITNFHISETKNIIAGAEIMIIINAQGDNISYSVDVPLAFGASLRQIDKNVFIYKVPAVSGTYRAYAIVEDNKGNIQTSTRSISVAQ